jgi:uncharacterized membrane protein YeaQ/YmgE (transglycosylase-associated protein family)
MTQGPIEFVLAARAFGDIGHGWPALIVIGCLAGLVARWMTSSQKRIGLLSSFALGIAGAALAWFATRWAGYTPTGPGMRFVVALGGSLLLAMLGGAMGRMLRRTPR